MSALPNALPRDAEATAAPRLAPKAAGYFFVVVAVTLTIAGPLLSRLSPETPGWPTFLVLGSIAATAQLFDVRMPRLNQSYHTTIVFLLPSAMLLPPELVALVGLVMHIP